jgi:glycogen debranching enzyme
MGELYEGTGTDGTAPAARDADEPARGTPNLPSAGDVDQLVRAQGTMFLVTDRNGDVAPAGARELGLYRDDTRHLSHYALSISAGQIVRLSAETTHDGYNQVDLMLTDLERGDVLDDPKNFLHVRRRQMLDAELAEQITFTSFLRRRVVLECTLRFGADFVDVFEVRGAKRPRRGRALPARVDPDRVVLAYEGLDERRYETRIAFSSPPADLDETHARFDLSLAPGETVAIEVSIAPSRSDDPPAGPPDRRSRAFTKRVDRLQEDAARFRDESTRFECDDAVLQHVLDQAIADLHRLRLHVGPHTILGAGIPWFCAPFGRDAILAAYEALLVNPIIAEESLRTLAAYQGTKHDPRTEEEPGKIFHELRFGEMARAGEIPHTPYYGTIDATPLFVILIDALHRVTGDTAFLREMRPALVAALGWIDGRSHEGARLVTYAKTSPRGLDNQGWKDSRAGVSFPDGRHAEPPIALCEVQGYCVDAYRRGARVLEALGDAERAVTYARRAEAMRAVVDREMWMEDRQRYAYAIDGRGRALPTVVSNLGHLLWSRVPDRDRAAGIARLLLAPPSFSGFGVRTLACDQAVYNPLSYHNGTVWPHDNALVARGFSNYDLADEAERVFEGLHASMACFVDRRLPELFCGMARTSGPLVRYPVACSPQSWAAAAPFLSLQALLGIHADAPHGRLLIRNPRLPRGVRRVELRAMRIGDALVSLRFRRVGGRCQVDRLEARGAPIKTEIAID